MNYMKNYYLYFFHHRDDLRTANIICESPEGVSCLVIDRETFNQLISNLDEVQTKYPDTGIEKTRYEVILSIRYLYLFEFVMYKFYIELLS